MNLVINTAESFSPEARGEVRVETRVELLDEGFFRPEEKQAGTYLSLIVSDTGSGMDAATQARIFDPFFTTKFGGARARTFGGAWHSAGTRRISAARQ